MSRISGSVSLHPYFKPNEGQWETFLGNLPAFVEKTSSEEGVLFYEFTVSDDTVFCREAYDSAASALHHLENVGALLDEALKISELVRLEIHGSAAELDQMREPLKDLPVQWFVLETGLERSK